MVHGEVLMLMNQLICIYIYIHMATRRYKKKRLGKSRKKMRRTRRVRKSGKMCKSGRVGRRMRGGSTSPISSHRAKKHV